MKAKVCCLSLQKVSADTDLYHADVAITADSLCDNIEQVSCQLVHLLKFGFYRVF